MLDYNDGMSLFDQSEEGIKELSYIMEVQSCRWLVEDEYGMFLTISFGKEGSQFDPLCFTTTQGATTLPQSKVS